MRAGTRRRWIATIAIALAATIGASSPGVSRAAPAYTNPVTAGTVDTFPDPVVIRGKDGYWYAYGTTNPIFQSKGEDGEHVLPILRSSDMTDWSYVGDVYTRATQPDWWPSEARPWAPEIRYIDGTYHLSYGNVAGVVGLATAPTPAGPWTDEGTVIPQGNGCPTGNIDQAQATDRDGTHYMYWGSYDVVCVAKMNADATRIVGAPTEVLVARRGEGAFVVRHDDWYYLFYSEAGCCQGAFSGYTVKAGRSRDPLGPFVDPQGTPLTAPETKDGFVVSGNGNRWVGPGHHGFSTDLSGQDWLVYHAIPKDDPDLDPVSSVPNRILSRRPMLIDRLDWVDGWPTVRGGEWASDDAQPAPVTTPAAGSDFNQQGLDGWRREGAAQDGWTLARETDAGGYVRQEAPAAMPAYLVRDAATAGAHVRAEADLRLGGGLPSRFTGSAGLVLAYQGPGDHVAVWLDAERHALVSEVVAGGRAGDRRRTALPPTFDFSSWHHIAAELRDGQLRIEVSSAVLGDALAVQDRTVPVAAPGSVGVASRGARTEADNVSATSLYQPSSDTAPEPQPGTLDPAASDEFDDGTPPGAAPGDGWRWVRDAEGSEADGQLSWATDGDELVTGSNDAAVLVRDAPAGEWIAETKLTFAPGSGGQEAGLIAYAGDDDYTKLVHGLVRLNPRFGGPLGDYTVFAKEGPRPTTGDQAFYGPMYVGPPAETMWLRLHHRFDAAEDEHELRAATSTDGERWVWGGVWTLDGELDPEIGLVTLGPAGATAHFDHLRVYR
ncbi:MAG: family 43 glycosylhydrolase [Solirubrobacteraceae bacterium]